jgi:hypothetical protein
MYIHSVVESTKESTRVTGVVGLLLHNDIPYTAHTPPTTPTENARRGSESKWQLVRVGEDMQGRRSC